MTVVVKLGTSLVVGARGSVKGAVLGRRAREIARVVRSGEPVAVVSSGAIALGLPQLGLDRRPRSVPKLQAASALGQGRLQRAWERALAREDLLAAQVLLTVGDLADRAAYVNARHALEALFAVGAVPIVNENDATATDEITFGDNDALAAQVAILVRARLLVLLTEVAGVYARARHTGSRDRRRRRDCRGRLRRTVTPWSRRMGSKVLAARMAADAGIPVIAGGPGGRAGADPRRRAARDTVRGRASSPRTSSGSASGSREGPSARDEVRDERSRSRAGLLAVGVVACEGRFEPGDAVGSVGPTAPSSPEGSPRPHREDRIARTRPRGRAPRPPRRALGATCSRPSGALPCPTSAAAEGRVKRH